ncbi:MAG: sulfatase [Planctomycetota bacterium]
MPSPHPNVLFILSDQHSAKVLGHAGHPDVQTPHLDRLAAEGVRFENAITQNPICTPSRVCFLSGQYCHNHGIYGLAGPRPEGLPTFLGHFRRHGYRTAHIGKSHGPAYWIEDDCDRFIDPTGCCIGAATEYSAFLDEDPERRRRLQETGARSGGQAIDGMPSLQPYAESREGFVARESIRFVDDCTAAGAPFCLAVSLSKPHQAYTPAQAFWDLYETDALTLPPNADNEDPHAAPHLKQTAAEWRAGDWIRFEPKTFEAARRRKLHGYLGCVSQTDHAVGELLDALDARGLADSTVVVYTSDHGDYAAEHGIMEKAPGICHDAITRIPFLWRAPGVAKAGHAAAELVEAVDVLPTLCGLAGLPVPETADGHDITPLLRGEAAPVRTVAVTEFAWSKSIRKGDWRLVYYPPEFFPDEYPDGFGELYHLAEDPWETRNRYFDPDCADRVRDLTDALLDWLVTTTRPTLVNGVNAGANAEARFPRREGRRRRYKTVVTSDNKIPPAWIAAHRGGNYI